MGRAARAEVQQKQQQQHIAATAVAAAAAAAAATAAAAACCTHRACVCADDEECVDREPKSKNVTFQSVFVVDEGHPPIASLTYNFVLNFSSIPRMEPVCGP